MTRLEFIKGAAASVASLAVAGRDVLSATVPELDPGMLYALGPFFSNGYPHYFPFGECGYPGWWWVCTIGNAHAAGHGPTDFEGLKLYPNNPHGCFHLMPKTGLPCELNHDCDERGVPRGPGHIPITGIELTGDLMSRCAEAWSSVPRVDIDVYERWGWNIRRRYDV